MPNPSPITTVPVITFTDEPDFDEISKYTLPKLKNGNMENTIFLF